MFEKKCDRTSDCPRCRTRILSWSFLTIVISTVTKGIAGVICGSRALMANAVSSFIDGINIGINYAGSRNSKADPFRLSVIIAVIMFLSGMWVFASNGALLISGALFHPGILALFISMLSSVTNWYFYRITVCANESDLDDHNVFLCMILNRSDFIASCITTAGILLAECGYLFFDPLGGVVIGCIMFKESLEILGHASDKKGPSGSSIKRAAMYTAGLLSCCIVGFYASDLAGTLNRRAIVLVPSRGTQLESQVDTVLGRAQYFIIINTKNNTAKAVLNTSRYLKTDVSNDILALVKENNVGVVLAQNIGTEMFNDLRLAGVKMYYIGRLGTVRDILSDYQNGQMEPAASPNVNKGFGRTRIRWFAPW
jgi:predicted Fe-Mo cluster-binding NifX family protein